MSTLPTRPAEPLATSQTFTARASIPNTPPLASWLYRLMVHKKSNLCLSADVETSAQLLDLAEECGDKIVLLKTHCDIVSDWTPKTAKGLADIARRKRFLIFEDRKFGDIGNTVMMQYAAGTHKIAQWATITNAHIFPGPSIIPSLRSAAHSAIAASHSTFSTEIIGGADSYFSAQRELGRDIDSYGNDRDGSRDLDDEDLEDDDYPKEEYEEPDPSASSATLTNDPDSLSRRQSATYRDSRRDSSGSTLLDRRKSSVVSISTTISSSTEYISPPPTSSAISPLSAGGLPPFDADKPPLTSRGLLLLAQMSSADNFFSRTYTDKCVELARQYRDFVIGFVAQEGLNRISAKQTSASSPADNFIIMTPGVSLPPSSSTTNYDSVQQDDDDDDEEPGTPTGATTTASGKLTGDGMGQQYNTPRKVIIDKGCDVIIIGRGILNARDVAVEAERYRRAGWDAYCKRTGDTHAIGPEGRGLGRR